MIRFVHGEEGIAAALSATQVLEGVLLTHTLLIESEMRGKKPQELLFTAIEPTPQFSGS